MGVKKGAKPLFIIIPLPLGKLLAPKVLHSCHSERSEESVPSFSENGFFVTSFLRMTFKAKPLIREGGFSPPAIAQEERRAGGVRLINNLQNGLILTSPSVRAKFEWLINLSL